MDEDACWKQGRYPPWLEVFKPISIRSGYGTVKTAP